ncbi:hypothetical protein HD806DRAFT_504514 [Xylariaceae sp. AK1471]|nr:hypothetical protein HD806DRAFT_504514 [Xylariaceae sp. AK1471]
MVSLCPYPRQSRYLKPIQPRDKSRRRSCSNLSCELFETSPKLTKSYSSSSRCRYTSESLAIRYRYNGVSKRQEPLDDWPLQPRSQSSNEGHAVRPDNSSPMSSINRTPGSLCEQVSPIASCVRSDSNANAETKGQSHVSGDEGLRITRALPLCHETEIEVEAKASGSPGDAYIPSLQLPLEPDTEYQANLAAASDETRPLFIEYYERTHGGDDTEDEDMADTYWKWDTEKKEWFHTNEDTESVLWFSSELTQPCCG